MRLPLLLLPILLAGCVNESASYSTANGGGDLTVVVTQNVFWKKEGALRLIASRMPDCQRQHELGKVPLADLNVELFSTGEDKFLLRVDDEMWLVEPGNCAQLPAPSDEVQAQPIGVFHFDKKKKLVFEAAEGAAK
jgi:hypothetical protein